METYNAFALGVALFVTGLFLGAGMNRRRFPKGKIDFLIDNALLTNEKLTSIMASEQEILDLLAEANTATNEIAEDIQKLIAREPQISEATKTALQEHVNRLKGVAAEYTPDAEEPGEGESES